MIIRHIPMKSARLSSFAGLVKYITDEQNKQERVGKIKISNCNSVDPTWAIHEVLATQARNQRAKGDKTYHLLISFAPGEKPSALILKEIEDRVVSSIGFKDHQRVSAIHHDTDNLHVHVAINKIHPKTFNMVEPYRAYKVFADVASTLEIEFGLQVTNHQTRKGHSENLADDMEQHSGIESLLNWMKRNCRDKIESADSWDEVHLILAQHKLMMRVRANGFVFCNEQGLTVKASSVSRSFSKKNLESKLGGFRPSPQSADIPTKNIYRYEPLSKKAANSEIYARYKFDRENSKIILSEKLKALRMAKTNLIDKAKKRGRIKRAAVKLIKTSKLHKKILYQQISKTLVNDIAQIRKNHIKERKQLINKHQSKTWADWLRHKSESGDQDALTALRYRNRKNNGSYALSGAALGFPAADFERIDSITKEGTEIYRLDKAVIRNDGKEIKISKGGTIPALKKAIEMARQCFGDCIRVNGSPLFQQTIIQLTVQNNIQITFADPNMEAQRQQMIAEQEKNNEQSRRHGFSDGKRASGSDEVVGTRSKRRGTFARAKLNPISTRQGPPAKGQNSLRDLSQLDVVQLAGGSKVLLPDNAHDQLEQQRLQPYNHVRRKASGLISKRKRLLK